MRRAAIVCASAEELRPALNGITLEVLDLPGGRGLGSIRHDDLLIDFAAVGCGARLTRRGLGALLQLRPEAIVFVGIAGALDATLRTGDGIIPDWFVTVGYPQPVFRHVTQSGRLAGILWQRMAGQGRLRRGGIFGSGVRLVCRSEEKLRIWRQTGAIAVDMESFEAVSICARHGIEFATLRVISDTASDDLPKWLDEAFDSRFGFDLSRVGLAMAEHPREAALLADHSAAAVFAIREHLPSIIECLGNLRP
jgi:nucleoside phosphorylase